MRSKLEVLDIDFEFSEPFQEDIDKKWTAIGKLYNDGIISLETAVKMLGITDKPKDEISKILEEKQNTHNNEINQANNNAVSPGSGQK